MRTPGIVINAPLVSPYEQAKAVYATEPCARTFPEDLLLHLKHGYVFNTPKMFLMGRPVWSQASSELTVDPAHKFSNVDAWLVYLAAGEMHGFFHFCPFNLRYIGWERENVLRFYPFELVKRKILHDYEINIDRECREVR